MILVVGVIVVIVWAVASISQSYAAAQQAKAAIEAAQAAQIASVTNLIVVGVGAVLLLALLAGSAYLLWLKNQPQPRARITARRETPPPQIPTATDPLTQLTHLMTLQMLRDMQRDMRREPPGATYLPGPRLNIPDEEER